MRRWHQLLLVMAVLITLGSHMPAAAAVPAMPAMDADCVEMMAPKQHSGNGSEQDEKSSPTSCMTALGCSMPAVALDDPVIPVGPDYAGNGFGTPVFTELLGSSRAPETHPPIYLG